MDNYLAQISYDYDELNRLTNVETVNLPASLTTDVGYRYDANGNRRQIIYPGSADVDYTYDYADRMNGIEDWASRVTSYEYNSDSSVATLSQNNGTGTEYSYDNTGRLTDVQNIYYGKGVITEHEYTLDAVGNITHTYEIIADGSSYPWDLSLSSREGTIDYTYDGMYRLLSEYRDMPSPQREEQWDYTYDPVGNRLTMVYYPYPTTWPANHDDTDFSYDKADRIIETTGEMEKSYTFNDNGNMTYWSDGLYNYPSVYDEENRLFGTIPDLGDPTYYYMYDGDGNRIISLYTYGSTPYTENVFVYDVNAPNARLIKDSGNRYVWGLGLLYMVDSSNNVYYYHQDGSGSVRAMTDTRTPTHRVKMYEEYEAFGNEGYSNRYVTQHFKYDGEYRDEDSTGYIYLRARYYDPTIGRFITRDPYAGDTTNPLSLNHYTFVENNPANKVDPSGLSSNKILWCNNVAMSCDARIVRGLIEAELARQQNVFNNLGPLYYPVGFISTLIQGFPFGLGVSEHVKDILDAADVSYIEYNGNLWDTSSYGNVVWGYQMSKLGFTENQALTIGDEFSYLEYQSPDPTDDKNQIVSGFQYGK